uniref:protein-tyrosine-phosphatase n=1 Tax=Strongyloides venezuelensis TaxID=75913 RepID=A0A0K0EXU3_STRVS
MKRYLLFSRIKLLLLFVISYLFLNLAKCNGVEQQTPFSVNNNQNNAIINSQTNEGIPENLINLASISTRLNEFSKQFTIKKDDSDPSRLLNVLLPTNFLNYHQFIAKVTDISPSVDFPLRDVNRTFLAFPSDSSIINIHGLHAGHKYDIAIYGRIVNETHLIKKEAIFMDPVPLNFHDNASIIVMHTNITMRALKPERALQDTFRVEYIQLSPPKRYPILDVHDIPEQKYVDFYLGNLNPGRDYDVKVTSIRADIPSQPWQGVITTKPLKVANITVTDNVDSNDLNCVHLSWMLPIQSGADKFKILYGPTTALESGMHSLEVYHAQNSVKICDFIIPGIDFLFIVSAEKSNQLSDPQKTTFTVKPLPPINLSLQPNIDKGLYKLTIYLNNSSKSKADSCKYSIIDDNSSRMEGEMTTEMIDGVLSCNTYLNLIPGKRYEVSANTFSNKKGSIKILRNMALAPGFDMKYFDLSLIENNGIITIKWPRNEVRLRKLVDIWSRIIGNDSTLQVKIESSSDGKIIKNYSTNPSTAKDIIIPNLIRGACYNIEIYTLTKNGIVSNDKYEKNIRISMTAYDINTENISKTSTIVTFNETGKIGEWYENSVDCKIAVLINDIHGNNIYDKVFNMQKADEMIFSKIILNNLKSYTKYAVNSQITCGKADDKLCPQSTRTMNMITFETEQDVPGYIKNLTIKPLNSYSCHVSWKPPTEPNGFITRYLIIINPDKRNLIEEVPWTLTVNGNFDSNNKKIDSIVDNLVGGQKYSITVLAVTVAGTSSVSNTDNTIHIQMPIGAPPKPSTTVEVIQNTIRSSDLSIRYNMRMLSSKNGPITKIGIIVAEVDPKTEMPREPPSHSISSSPSSSYTWYKVQNYEISPPYITSITNLKPQKNWGTKSISEVIGIEPNCESKDPDTICNGPLKANTMYRFKLRMYTADNLWTDTNYSNIAKTDLLKSGFMFRTILLFILLALCIAIAIILLICINNCRMSKKNNEKKRPVLFGGCSSSNSNGSSSLGIDRNYGSSSQNSTSSSNEVSPNHSQNQWTAFKMLIRNRTVEIVNKFSLDQSSFTNHHTSKDINNTTSNCINTNSQRLPNSSKISMYENTEDNNNKTPISSPIIISHTNGQMVNSSIVRPINNSTKTLKQRTGFDKRLENIGTVPPKIILQTVMKVDNLSRSRPVKMEDFLEHVRLMSADSDFRFSEEYEELRNVGITQPCVASELPTNRAKNRFTNILPYDHSRVKLISSDDDDGSDYINANYIPGFNSRREFIAAQGPLPSTRDHFWQMVWEQQVPFIVALTKCIEKGRDKCHQYWPDQDQLSVLYNDIEVTLAKETMYDDYVLRELHLTNMSYDNLPKKVVYHLHYKAWPDFGVPNHPGGILHIVRLFRSKVPPSKNCRPSIIHCSAGVGRSGTFIAIDRLLQCMAISQPLDVFGIVHEMRLERCQMVQNEQQYVFIHLCIAHAIEQEMLKKQNFMNIMSINQLPQRNISQNQLLNGIPNTNIQYSQDYDSQYSSPQRYNGVLVDQHQPYASQRTMNTSLQEPSNIWINPYQQGQPIEGFHTIDIREFHQNPIFIEEDEGIAESGL